jgi:hypothetical protein
MNMLAVVKAAEKKALSKVGPGTAEIMVSLVHNASKLNGFLTCSVVVQRLRFSAAVGGACLHT